MRKKDLTSLAVKEKSRIPVKYFGFLSRYENSNTQGVVNHNIKHFIQFLTANGYTVENIDQSILNIYLDGLRKKGLSNSAYNQNVSNIKKCLEYFGHKHFEYKTAKRDAYQSIKLVSETAYRNIIRFLAEQKDTEAKKHTKYLRDFVLFNTLFLTGLRKNELISLKHLDIRPEAGKYFYFAKCKGGKEIKKEFPEHLINDIQELKRLEKKTDKDYIFTSIYTVGGKKLSQPALNKILNIYHRKINGAKETVTVHSVRNLSAFKLFSLTKDILKTKEHLNHSNLNTTQIYLSKLQSNGIDYYSELAESMK